MVKDLYLVQQNQNSFWVYLERLNERILGRQIQRKHRLQFQLTLRVHIVATTLVVLQPLDNDLEQFFHNHLYNFQLRVVVMFFRCITR